MILEALQQHLKEQGIETVLHETMHNPFLCIDMLRRNGGTLNTRIFLEESTIYIQRNARNLKSTYTEVPLEDPNLLSIIDSKLRELLDGPWSLKR